MIENLAYSLGRNDEQCNIDLAIKLCETDNENGINEIVEGLKNKEQRIANDCIKVIYEIGERKPKLISGYVAELVELLKSKNNRLIWGGMTALATIVDLKPNEVFSYLDSIKEAYQKGSVITVDNSITVFAKLCRVDKKYEELIFPILLNHLSTCRPKEVPQHSERTVICINQNNREKFISVINNRKKELTDSQIKRINKVIKQC